MPAILKPCPDCGELICPQAMNCDHCASADPFGKARRKDKQRNIISVILAVLCLIVAILLYSALTQR